jgi:hypothetical protein
MKYVIALLVSLALVADCEAFYRKNNNLVGGAVTVVGALTANAGMSTADGYGIGIGVSAPTTNALELGACGTASSTTSGSATAMRVAQNGSALWYFRTNSGNGSIVGNVDYFSTFDGTNVAAANIKGNTITNKDANGAPAFTYGLTLKHLATPGAPAAGDALIYSDDATHTLNVITSISDGKVTTEAP